MKDEYLDQVQASEFLRDFGVHLSPRTLQKRRVVGGSPPFLKICSRVLYPKTALASWAEEQRSTLVKSTSELA